MAGALVAFLAGRCVTRGWTRLEVRGESMLPALREGDWLIARKTTEATAQVFAPGDIVVARDPRDGRPIIKRVEWSDASYVSLLGDNFAASRDSRQFGPLEAGAIESVVVFRYWPPGRIGRVR